MLRKGGSDRGARGGQRPRFRLMAAIGCLVGLMALSALLSIVDTGFAGLVCVTLRSAIDSLLLCALILGSVAGMGVMVHIFRVSWGSAAALALGIPLIMLALQGLGGTAGMLSACLEDLGSQPVAHEAQYLYFMDSVSDEGPDQAVVDIDDDEGDLEWPASSSSYALLSAAQVKPGENFIIVLYPRSHVIVEVDPVR